MKLKAIIVVLLVATFSLSYTSITTGNDSPYVIVRVIECQGGDSANESMILIDRGDNKIEKISLDAFHKKNFELNFKTISKMLNDIKAQGFELISTSGGGGNDNAMILQNYIFKKV